MKRLNIFHDFFFCPEGDFYTISGTFEPPGGFFDRHEQFLTAIDIFFFRDLYLPTMVRGVNRHKKARLASTAEKETLIHRSHP